MEHHVTDDEIKEPGEATAVEGLTQELKDKLDEDGLHARGA